MNQVVLMENMIERNIKEWLRKNPRVLHSVRGDRSMINKQMVSRHFRLFINESPRIKMYLKKIGIYEEGLTDAGYCYVRRIADSISV